MYLQNSATSLHGRQMDYGNQLPPTLLGVMRLSPSRYPTCRCRLGKYEHHRLSLHLKTVESLLGAPALWRFERRISLDHHPPRLLLVEVSPAGPPHLICQNHTLEFQQQHGRPTLPPMQRRPRQSLGRYITRFGVSDHLQLHRRTLVLE